MKSLKFIVIGAIAFAGTSAFADLKSDWQKMLDKYVALSKKRDEKGLESFILANFAPDFSFTSKAGQKLDRKGWIEQSKQEMKMTGKVTKVVYHIESVKMIGKDKALCKTTIIFEGTVQMDPKGKPVAMTMDAKSDQGMVKKGGKWWIQSMTNTEEKATMNGKPMKM